MEKNIAIISTILGVVTGFISLYKELYGIYNNRKDQYHKKVLEPFYLSVMNEGKKILNVREWLKESYMLLPSKIAVLVNDGNADELEILKMLLVDYVNQSHTLENVMFNNLLNVFIILCNIILVGFTSLLGYEAIILVEDILNKVTDNMKLYNSPITGILISLILPLIILYFLVVPMWKVFFKFFRMVIKDIDSYSNITLKEANARRKSNLKTYNKLLRKKNTLAIVFENLYIRT